MLITRIGHQITEETFSEVSSVIQQASTVHNGLPSYWNPGRSKFMPNRNWFLYCENEQFMPTVVCLVTLSPSCRCGRCRFMTSMVAAAPLGSAIPPTTLWRATTGGSSRYLNCLFSAPAPPFVNYFGSGSSYSHILPLKTFL